MANPPANPHSLRLPPIYSPPIRGAENPYGWGIHPPPIAPWTQHDSERDNFSRASLGAQNQTGQSLYHIPAFQSFPNTAPRPAALRLSKEGEAHMAHDRSAAADNHFGPSLNADLADPSHLPAGIPVFDNHPTGHAPMPTAGPSRHSATTKVAGSRRKKAVSPPPKKTAAAKGKRKRTAADSDLDDSEALTDSEDERPATTAVTTGHGGRRPGAGNYKDCDLTELLDLTEKQLPLGQRGWQKVYKEYEVWAKANGRPLRDARSLELKFKSLAKQTKPTGTGKRPTSVTRAKAIDRLINERAATRSLNDSDIENEPQDDVEPDEPAESSPRIHTATIRSNKSDSLPSRRSARASQSTELMQRLTSALDPDVQRARDEDRSNRSFQNTHILTLNQQLRDSQASNETLRQEVNTLRERVHKLERQLDRARFKLEIHHGPAPKRAKTGRKDLPDLIRVRGKIRHDEFFPDGGCETSWITDGSTATDWSETLSDKENYGFGAYPDRKQYRRRRSPSPVPFSDHRDSSTKYSSSRPSHKHQPEKFALQPAFDWSIPHVNSIPASEGQSTTAEPVPLQDSESLDA
ncbi:hypothetical protein HYPSUDRAFT_56502 [Hypholoma sublateritium FD-334 SS-4]|uniref:DUF6818 domain-containing protein n=1 Tax=Hypholoma sublateritium (strain FD-334 SS-4) TaxID=945553 RepID=A0A0D2NLC2_HYPSF|nr:hypothetical protein HYPSUDRAFT_56502 [Hypholoma sublateritium FD-334 SS-4]